ncbi:hypothetical protein PIB30_092067, partial [Stylosanthes scabra]|nr:hypothetical protein [Stylosanthes scabra]
LWRPEMEEGLTNILADSVSLPSDGEDEGGMDRMFCERGHDNDEVASEEAKGSVQSADVPDYASDEEEENFYYNWEDRGIDGIVDFGRINFKSISVDESSFFTFPT